MTSHSTNPAAHSHHQQSESTLYMPSMYDTDDEEEDNNNTMKGSEARDDGIKKVQGSEHQLQHRESRYSLQRCLAWSQEELEVNENRMDADTEDVLVLAKIVTDLCMVPPPSNIKNHSANQHIDCRELGDRIHWESHLASGQDLGSMLSCTKRDTQ